MDGLNLVLALRGVEIRNERIDGGDCAPHRMPERDFGFSLRL